MLKLTKTVLFTYFICRFYSLCTKSVWSLITQKQGENIDETCVAISKCIQLTEKTLIYASSD